MRALILIVMAAMIAAFIGCNRQDTPSNTMGSASTESISESARLILEKNMPTTDDINRSWAQVMGGDPQVSVADTSYDVYVIMMLWGQIPPVSADVSTSFDWSGNAGVNAVGWYEVMFPISFESGEDKVVPSGDLTTVAWISRTGCDVDGLATMLCLKRGIEYFVEPHLVYATGMANLDIPISRLTKFDTLITVNPRQTLLLWARRITITPCPMGTFSGDWVRRVNTGDSGYFHGYWYGSDGQPVGPLAGAFWTNSDGTREFGGAWSQGILTVIAGYVKGKWYFMDPSACPTCGSGMGRFEGTFTEMIGVTRSGKVWGTFGTSPGPGAQVMPFKGVWKVDCEDVNNNTSTTDLNIEPNL